MFVNIFMPHLHFIMYICFILTSPQQVRPVPPSGGQVCRTSALFYTQSNKGFGPGFIN